MRSVAILAAVILALVIGAGPAARSQASGKITVNVIGLRNDEGAVRCDLYNAPDGFRQPGREFRGVVAQISGLKAACVFDGVPPNVYAVALFHAEHNEQKLTYGFFGAPEQPYGFSNNPDTTFGPASFRDAAFTYGGGDVSITVKMKN
jgi:uncharacterized protein (DUF2141 family)